MDRRAFLKGMAASALVGGWAPEAWAHDFPVVVGGEDNRVGHMLRDGHVFAIPAPSRTVDVAIVGAGVSGLVSAYQLRDHDVLLIEKEDRVGGHARKGHWHDVSYAEGAAYVEDISGYVGELAHALKVPLKPIHEPADAMYMHGRFYPEILGKGARQLGGTRAERAGYQAFIKALAEVKDPPPLPVEDAHTGQLHTDQYSFGSWVKPYGRLAYAYADLYCRSALGGPADAVSAYWGLDFLCGESATKYTAPGGNAAYAQALLQAVGPQRVVTGATVVRVEHGSDQVLVSYVQGEQVTTVKARTVIMACAKHITRRAVVGLPEDQVAAMARMRYEPYMVINVLVDGPCDRRAYDTWVPGAPFTDVTVADWINPDHGRRHAVLTCYCPQAEADRYKLLDATYPTQLARACVTQLDRMQPGLAGRIHEVRVFRWGHPMVLSAVNAITQLRDKVVRPYGRVLISGGDNQMCATIEAAIHEGRKAGLAAKAMLGARKGP